jgi:hypothetical protein
MECLYCNKSINFKYYILRHGIVNNTVEGVGEFCSIACAKSKLSVTNHGDSDYFECLTLMNQKYGACPYYEPPVTVELAPLLQPVEIRMPQIPTYQVKRASKNKKSTNEILSDFCAGKCEPIMTAKNLCATK